MEGYISNESSAEIIERSHGETFDSRRILLGEAAGGEHLGCSLYEIPPDASHCPYHYHSANEEAAYILAGRGTLRVPDGDAEITAGDYIAFPVGERGAHQIMNTSNEPLRYLCISTMHEPEVAVYPDSEKLGVYWGEGANAPSKIFKIDDEVDYWLDEV